ncbi:MAG: hypothetical protein Kow0099_00530 [Candidatus Abyssubacteria bacterium]
MHTARLLGLVFLIFTGCSTLDEGYNATYGLTNPEHSVAPSGSDEDRFVGDGFGQRSIEQYDKKYHDDNIFRNPRPELIEEDTAEP